MMGHNINHGARHQWWGTTSRWGTASMMGHSINDGAHHQSWGHIINDGAHHIRFQSIAFIRVAHKYLHVSFVINWYLIFVQKHLFEVDLFYIKINIYANLDKVRLVGFLGVHSRYAIHRNLITLSNEFSFWMVNSFLIYKCKKIYFIYLIKFSCIHEGYTQSCNFISLLKHYDAWDFEPLSKTQSQCMFLFHTLI